MIGLPRIQGKVGIIEDPPDKKGLYAFTIWFSIMGHAEKKEIGPFGPFKTKKEAQTALKAEAKNMSGLICKLMKDSGIKNSMSSDEYFDLKEGVIRKWQEH